LTGLAAFSLLLGAMAGSARADVSGMAQVVDGDTLIVAGTRVRLWGADAPPFDFQCRKGERTYACGKDATRFLRDVIGNRGVRCEDKGTTAEGDMIGRCHTGFGDLAWLLVESGNAFATDRLYRDAEASARAESKGLWAGDFADPSQWQDL